MEFNREIMIEVLVYHWPTKSSGCHCGWAELGKSFPEHVVKVYEDSVRLRTPEPIKIGDMVEVPKGNVGRVRALIPAAEAIQVTFGDNPSIYIYATDEVKRIDDQAR